VKNLPAILFLAFMLIAGGCAVSGKKSKKAMRKLGPALTGRWEGILPCRDCPVLNYTLHLQGDGSYQEKIARSLKDSIFEKHSGTWTISKDSTVNIVNSKSGTKQYKFRNGRLEHTQENDGLLTSPNYKPSYILIRANEETMKAHQAMYRKGLFFTALNSEGSWELQISKTGKLSFLSSASGKTLSSAIRNQKQLMIFPDTMRIILPTSPRLNILLSKKTCLLAGQSTDYTVTIAEDGNSNMYTGCGFFLSDYRLNDIWVLESVNNRPIRKRKGEKNNITMQIHPGSGRVYGSSYCNSYHADIDIRYNSMIIGPVVSTRMHCSDAATEQYFFKLLSGKQYTYSIKRGKLYLRTGKTTLVFHISKT